MKMQIEQKSDLELLCRERERERERDIFAIFKMISIYGCDSMSR